MTQSPSRPHPAARHPLASGTLLALLASLLIAAPGTPLAGRAGAEVVTTGTISEIAIPTLTAAAEPVGITSGPDGNLWFTDATNSGVGKVATNGTGATVHATLTPSAEPVAIASDGSNLWFTEFTALIDQVGRTTVGGVETDFGVSTSLSLATGLTLGPDGRMWIAEKGANAIGAIAANAGAGTKTTDYPLTGTVHPEAIVSLAGNLWFTEQSTGKIGEMNTSGTVLNEFAAATGVDGLAAGPDGNLWFTAPGVVGRMTTGGSVATFPIASSNPTSITAGPDGNLWFTDQGTNKVGSVTTGGTVQEYAVPTAGAFSSSTNIPPTGITAGLDGNIWFTEPNTGKIGKLLISPSVAIAPASASLTFGSQAIGSASAPQVVTATSTGGGTLSIASVTLGGTSAADFRIVSDGCGGQALIPAHNSCTVSVAFSPTTGPLGARNATLTFADDAGTQSQVVNLSGSATSGAGFNQSSISFGNQAVSSTSAPVTLTFSNNAGASFSVTSTSVTGPNPDDFPIVDGCSGATLATGQTCTIQVSFTPGSLGPRSAILTVTDGALGSPQTVPLSGTGVAATLSFTQTLLPFGNQQVGVTSTSRAAVLTNVSNSPVAVTSTSITGAAAGDFAVTSDSCSGTTVAPGGTCAIGVVFHPSSQGIRAASLQVHDTGIDSPQSITLLGRGVVTLGYWLVASDGGIFSYGSVVFHGSAGGIHLNKPIVGMAATTDAGGYWLVATDGGIFSYGDAKFLGSTGSLRLNKPIVGMATTPDGGGYWLVASDGGIFSYGDATFYGSTGSLHLNRPIVGMVPTVDGHGYWLVASDGGIFSYGDATFYGSTGAIHLNKPIVGMAASPDGAGYWLVATDGGIFSYGDARFFGSTGSIHLNKPIVGMAGSASGNGYWMVATDGGIFAFGDASFDGSAGSIRLNQPIVGMAPGF
ncbi:MAG TPA: choice-of-anchor D domain-containing protein [Actinomycetota bacterium]|nr:choice-of-anchor D domain-containing protein [Actinomycetota bacterium]